MIFLAVEFRTPAVWGIGVSSLRYQAWKPFPDQQTVVPLLSVSRTSWTHLIKESDRWHHNCWLVSLLSPVHGLWEKMECVCSFLDDFKTLVNSWHKASAQWTRKAPIKQVTQLAGYIARPKDDQNQTAFYLIFLFYCSPDLQAFCRCNL